MAVNIYPHILLKDPPETRPFKGRGWGENIIPTRNRRSHSNYLNGKFAQAWTESESEHLAYHISRSGIYLEFKGEEGYDLVTKSLENLGEKIRLLNIREDKDNAATYATVYIPNLKKGYFLNRLGDYSNPDKDTIKGNPKHNDLVSSISEITKAMLKSFWTDDPLLIPDETEKWCEVWLRIIDAEDETQEIINRFDELLNGLEIETKDGVIFFPERAVKVIRANRSQLEHLIRLSDEIAEFRHAKETTDFWIEMASKEQTDWVKDLLKRLRVDPDSNIAICILDTGVNNGHPLISPFLKDEDCQSVKPEWGVDDHDEHGTLMAGVTAYGDLIDCLQNRRTIQIRHLLESVKILPNVGSSPIELWGFITAQGAYKSEIQAPDRRRVFCMAVTAVNNRGRGRPSSWSGMLDKLTSGTEDNHRRLFIVSAGNITDLNKVKNYPTAQISDSIQDPAQSWNALTVGAYTVLDQISNPDLKGYLPLAPKGGLSPFTTTSRQWEEKWPIKPDVVFEGGNLAINSDNFPTKCDELSALSTYYKPIVRSFESFEATSLATAQASWFAAQIQAQYPDYWPETIRALMVHSAEWTDELKRQFLENNSKTAYKNLLKICGYGVPNLYQAIQSASNSLTLIAQNEIQPFDKDKSGYKCKEMHFYALKWPKDVLQSLPLDTVVKMRITLSYFIEPGPGEIGWKDRYRYASHGLRFDIKSPNERPDQFEKRINIAEREKGEKSPETDSASDYWLFGSQARNKGSIHSDIWKGSAAELAESNVIAIYPVVGWWRERHHLGKWSRSTRYALVVSISTPEETVDIYTPVANQIGITIPIQT